MLYVTGLALLAGVVIGLAGGGRFRFLARRRMRAVWLVAVGFGLQYATDHLNVGGLGTTMVLAGAVALLVFAALNPTLVGIGVVTLGVAANALVIAADNGMPVRPSAVTAAHITTRAEEPSLGYGYRHHREGPGDRLRPLGDILPIPPFREVVSFGDLILAFGVAATLAHLLRPLPRHAATSPPGTLETSWRQDDMLAPKFAVEPARRPPETPETPETPAKPNRSQRPRRTPRPRMSAPVAAIVSFRLGGADGVSVEAAKWGWALKQLGFAVRTVAGASAGPVDHLIPGLAAGSDLNQEEPPPVDLDALDAALRGADLVVVENLLSLPLNPAAAAAVAQVLRGRPAILRHHDLPWQRTRFAGYPPPPDDPAWVHVTINDHSRRELAERDIAAVTVANAFDPDPPAGDRDAVRHALGLADDAWLVLQPTRAIARKNVPAGLALAEAIGATFWLLGPAEEGYGPELARLLEQATTPTRHGPAGPVSDTTGIEHAYAGCDLVVFPSHCEGFGNPPIEAALHRRPVAVGRYQVGQELRARGFRWWDATDHDSVGDFLRSPDTRLLDHNEHIARTYFSLEQLPATLFHLLRDAGWQPR